MWGQQIADSIARDGSDLDAAFDGKPFQIQISKAKSNTKLRGKRTLSRFTVSIEFTQNE